MVVNTRYQFIFVHVPKAAGTSIMDSLQKLQGNHRRWLVRTKHETLAEFEKAIPSRQIFLDRMLHRDPQSYFKFGFVRNPWDRMASLYRYLVESKPKTEIDTVAGFKDFLIKAAAGEDWITSLHSIRSQLDYFTYDDNRMAIDFLGHYEHLQEDIATLAHKLGISLRIGHRNQSSNTWGDYRTQYDPEMIDIVSALYADEIDVFGYTFDDKTPRRRCSDKLNCIRGSGGMSRVKVPPGKKGNRTG